MAFSTQAKLAVNQLLTTVNVKIDTLTAERQELARIARMEHRGHFSRPAYPLLPGCSGFSPTSIVAALQRYDSEIKALMRGGCAPGLFDPGNTFFRSPDAEVLYAFVRDYSPRRIIEVGSGNSTRIIRQALHDGQIRSVHIAIDPCPRSDIATLVDTMINERLEEVEMSCFESLGPGDILFIDSSHEVRTGNDVATLFCCILPALQDGVIVHVHDVFLPYDYPEHFSVSQPNWGEQYLLQAHLASGNHEILWPGYYYQRLGPGSAQVLPVLENGAAQSFWWRVRRLTDAEVGV